MNSCMNAEHCSPGRSMMWYLKGYSFNPKYLLTSEFQWGQDFISFENRLTLTCYGKEISWNVAQIVKQWQRSPFHNTKIAVHNCNNYVLTLIFPVQAAQFFPILYYVGVSGRRLVCVMVAIAGVLICTIPQLSPGAQVLHRDVHHHSTTQGKSEYAPLTACTFRQIVNRSRVPITCLYKKLRSFVWGTIGTIEMWWLWFMK